MEYLAEVKDLRVKYGDVVVVDGVSFALKQGEILAMIGPNGCGKTSTVECLEGLRKPDGGTIALFEKESKNQGKAIFYNLGVQLQEGTYPDKLKVEEICIWFSSFYENPADYEKLLERLGLLEKRKSYISKLSGGQRQRLSILLALLPRPKMLILDELTTGLDPEARRDLWEILQFIKKAGVGILLVSHYMDEVEYLADRILFMRRGHIIYDGDLLGFRNFAMENLPKEKQNPTMSLEEIYLAFASHSTRDGKTVDLEGIL